MFLDITPDLLAEGEVLGHGTADDLIEGLDIHRPSYRAEKQGKKRNALKKIIWKIQWD